MSYAHHDDSEGRLTKFRERLAGELRSQTGIDMDIFKDSDAIKLGEQWRKRLDEGLAGSTFLLPIVTPSFLTSAYCREELATFLAHEQALGRDDLILPVYYIDCEGLWPETSDEPPAATLRVILERQYFDWRELRSMGPSDRRVERARTRLAAQIREAIARSAASPREPAVEIRKPRISPPRPVDAKAPIDVLPSCCVRIDVGGRHAGSGFFAAPGTVVTCHHVLRLEELSSDEAGASISVTSTTGEHYRVLEARELSEKDDLAILRVEPAHAHAFVLLDTGFRERDQFATFAFSEDDPDGTGVALMPAGWIDRDRLLKVSEDGIGRGMSGCPVLNRRTGAVCGVLTRGVQRPGLQAGPASGSRIVSVRRLFHLRPTLSSANFRHHTTHRDAWFDLLPREEQSLLLVQRPSDPASLPDWLLVISVDQRDDEWEVSASVHHRGDELEQWTPQASRGPFAVDLNSVRALVARVFRDWASREHGRVGPGEQIRLLGEILSRALLREQIAEEFHELMTRPDLGWLEVALHFSEVDDPGFNEFVQLPWEHLYVPPRARRGDVYFAREPKMAFVRTLNGMPGAAEPSGGKLSVLVVSVKPESRDGVVDDAHERDVQEITDGLKALVPRLAGSLDVTVIESPGLHGLAEAVSHGDYDAVHYVGVGRFDAGSDDRIMLEINPTGRGGYHNASDFGACLEGECMPRLVVLQVCRSSEAVPPDLASFGPALLMKEGCHAVVAYQYPVSSALTQKFNTALYTALTEGTPLEMAAQIARKKVWASDSEGRAFLSPAVFVQSPGGLRLTPPGHETAARSRVGALSGHG